MKNIIEKLTRICLLVPFLGMSMAITESAVGQSLVTGKFECVVSVTEPPVGTGVPRASASMSFNQPLGIIGGPTFARTDIGTGSGLEASCQELAERMSSLAQDEKCSVAAIQVIHTQGGNFMSDKWGFDMLCNASQTRVVKAIGTILEAILITPPVVQQIIQETSNEMRGSDTNVFDPPAN